MSEKNDTLGHALTWKSRWVLRRNRILGSANFQQWAMRMPIFRGVAQRRAAAQFDLIAGFVYTQVLTALVSLGLIEFLCGKLRTAPDICQHSRLDPDAADRLLRASAALRLVESPQAGLWTLGEEGAPLSVNPGALAMIRHHHLLYRDLGHPVALLRGGRAGETALSQYWTYASKRTDVPEAVAVSNLDYSALMAATQPMVVAQIIDQFDFAAHTKMLDVGGGSGAFVSAIAEVAPNLSFGIFDLPDVTAAAKPRITAAGLDTRVTLHTGSFKQDALPTGYDVITLVRILHDHDDAVVMKLLRSIFAALPLGGRLLIVEPMAENRSAPRMGDAYFGLYLWAMGSGLPRSMATYRALLEHAGFAKIHPVKTAMPIITSACVAIK